MTKKQKIRHMKAKLLPQSDVEEIVRFQQYLADQQTMPREEFYRKYQGYMGLSDAEQKLRQQNETVAANIIKGIEA